jgi:hypothetical protein
MKALLMILAATGVSLGADVTVRLAEGENPGLLKLVTLERLFEPQAALKPDSTTSDSLIFKRVEPGRYSVVVWEAIPAFASSPTFDLTIAVEANDIEVRVRDVRPIHDLVLKLPPKLYARARQLYAGTPFVPCHLQRLDPPYAPSFGYRWLLLREAGDGELSCALEIKEGEYLFTIPFPVAREAFPPPRVPVYRLRHPLVAFPLTVTEDLSVQSEFSDLGVVIKPRTLSKSP